MCGLIYLVQYFVLISIIFNENTISDIFFIIGCWAIRLLGLINAVFCDKITLIIIIQKSSS